MNRALSALGLARRAGKLNWGFDTAVEAMRSGGAGVGGLAGEAMQLGVGLGTVGSVIGMTKEAISPIMQQSMSTGGWDCTCGQKDIMSNFCPNCGAKKPAPQMEGGWDCTCGQTGITSKFCPNCGAKKPEAPKPWDCACDQTGIISKFCPNCGAKKPDIWDCDCGQKHIATNFCPNCGKKKEN